MSGYRSWADEEANEQFPLLTYNNQVAREKTPEDKRPQYGLQNSNKPLNTNHHKPYANHNTSYARAAGNAYSQVFLNICKHSRYSHDAAFDLSYTDRGVFLQDLRTSLLRNRRKLLQQSSR
jgi:hypothetical protein